MITPVLRRRNAYGNRCRRLVWMLTTIHSEPVAKVGPFFCSCMIRMSLSVPVYTMIGRERRQSNMYGRLQRSSGHAKDFLSCQGLRGFYAVISHTGTCDVPCTTAATLECADLFAYYKYSGSFFYLSNLCPRLLVRYYETTTASDLDD